MTESRLWLEDRQCSDRPLGKPGLWSQACHPAGECSGLSQPATHPFMSCLLMPPAHTGFLFNWCPKACATRQLGQALGFMGSCTDAWSGNVRPRSTQILKSSSTSWGRLDHSPSPQNWNCAPARMPSTKESEWPHGLLSPCPLHDLWFSKANWQRPWPPAYSFKFVSILFNRINLVQLKVISTYKNIISKQSSHEDNCIVSVISKVIWFWGFEVVTVVCENTIVRCYSQKKYHKHHQRKNVCCSYCTPDLNCRWCECLRILKN